MKKFTLDTNIYIDAWRDSEALTELTEFAAARTPALYLTAVVAHELLAGVRPGAAGTSGTTRAVARLTTAVIRPFETRGRMMAPSDTAWRRAGVIRAALAAGAYPQITAGFLNDLLLAVTCHEHGLTLITRNTRDFAAIERALPGFRFVAPFP